MSAFAGLAVTSVAQNASKKDTQLTIGIAAVVASLLLLATTLILFLLACNSHQNKKAMLKGKQAQPSPKAVVSPLEQSQTRPNTSLEAAPSRTDGSFGGGHTSSNAAACGALFVNDPLPVSGSSPQQNPLEQSFAAVDKLRLNRTRQTRSVPLILRVSNL